MEPAAALETLETALRTIVREVLGDDWIKHISDPVPLHERQVAERNKRDGLLTSEDLLAFTMLYQLHGVILKNWESFKPVFDDKPRFQVWMKEVDHVRDAIAHSRPLSPHERDLISGISGQVRNLITLYRTNKMPMQNYYPLIEYVRDSFGTDGYESNSSMDGYQIPWDHQASLRLDVSMPVSFECRGTDPRGRALEWMLGVNSELLLYQDAEEQDWQATDDGSIVLTWTPNEGDVGENALVSIFMRAKGTKYSRQKTITGTRGVDDARAFIYAVNPPRD